MNHFAIIVTMVSAILAILVTILGFLVRGVASFVRLVTKVDSLEKSTIELTKTIAGVIVDVAVARHSDETLEERIQSLEAAGRKR